MLLSQCEGYWDLRRCPMKDMLTEPVTIFQWSFVHDDQPHQETCFHIALADSAIQTPSGLASTIFTRRVCQPNRRWPILFSVPEKSSSLSSSGESECGLRTCGWPEVETALVNMVDAAKSARHHVWWYDIMSDWLLDLSCCLLCWQKNKCGIVENSGACWSFESSQPSEIPEIESLPNE